MKHFLILNLDLTNPPSLDPDLQPNRTSTSTTSDCLALPAVLSIEADMNMIPS